MNFGGDGGRREPEEDWVQEPMDPRAYDEGVRGVKQALPVSAEQFVCNVFCFLRCPCSSFLPRSLLAIGPNMGGGRGASAGPSRGRGRGRGRTAAKESVRPSAGQVSVGQATVAGEKRSAEYVLFSSAYHIPGCWLQPLKRLT